MLRHNYSDSVEPGLNLSWFRTFARNFFPGVTILIRAYSYKTFYNLVIKFSKYFISTHLYIEFSAIDLIAVVAPKE